MSLFQTQSEAVGGGWLPELEERLSSYKGSKKPIRQPFIHNMYWSNKCNSGSITPAFIPPIVVDESKVLSFPYTTLINQSFTTMSEMRAIQIVQTNIVAKKAISNRDLERQKLALQNGSTLPPPLPEEHGNKNSEIVSSIHVALDEGDAMPRIQSGKRCSPSESFSVCQDILPDWV